jgi:hypothetical protein
MLMCEAVEKLIVVPAPTAPVLLAKGTPYIILYGFYFPLTDWASHGTSK